MEIKSKAIIKYDKNVDVNRTDIPNNSAKSVSFETNLLIWRKIYKYVNTTNSNTPSKCQNSRLCKLIDVLCHRYSVSISSTKMIDGWNSPMDFSSRFRSIWFYSFSSVLWYRVSLKFRINQMVLQSGWPLPTYLLHCLRRSQCF